MIDLVERARAVAVAQWDANLPPLPAPDRRASTALPAPPFPRRPAAVRWRAHQFTQPAMSRPDRGLRTVRTAAVVGVVVFSADAGRLGRQRARRLSRELTRCSSTRAQLDLIVGLHDDLDRRGARATASC